MSHIELSDGTQSWNEWWTAIVHGCGRRETRVQHNCGLTKVSRDCVPLRFSLESSTYNWALPPRAVLKSVGEGL